MAGSLGDQKVGQLVRKRAALLVEMLGQGGAPLVADGDFYHPLVADGDFYHAGC